MSGLVAQLALASAVLGGVWLSYRYPWWRKPVSYDKPRILMYHMVIDRQHAGPVPNLAVSPMMFERQIAHLKRTGWHFATVSELLAEPVAEKTVAITFDDGYQNNLTHALPVLLRHHAKATVYLIAEREQPLTEGGRDNGAPLAPLLSDGDVRALLQSKVIELGAHTLTHRNLANANETAQRQELGAAKLRLEQDFGQSVAAFAYPFGGVNQDLSQLVAAAGYTSAVTTEQGISADMLAERLRLRRIKISGRDNFCTFLIRLRIGRKR